MDGRLSVALVPLLGFMSSTVNRCDAVRCLCGIFFCLARGFRRGLARRLAIVLGSVTAVGFMTKVNFVGLAPGVLLGLVLLSVRATRREAQPHIGAFSQRSPSHSAQ